MLMKTYEKLLPLLVYLKNNVEYYKHYLPDINEEISPDEIMGLFTNIPTIEKSEIKSDYRIFISDKLMNYDISELITTEKDFKREYSYRFDDLVVTVEYTSGTNGSPFLSIKSNNERLILGNYLWKLRSKFNPVKTSEFFNFIHNFGVKSYPFPFDYIEDEIERLQKEINYLRNSEFKWWHINPYRLGLYSKIVQENNIEFKNLKVIENNGSFISSNEKEEYGNIFNCLIANHYGCRETWTIAYDCPCGHLHLNEECLYFELIDDNGCVITESNKTGKVVITSYNQRIMPVVRYRLEDYAYYINTSCKNFGRAICLLPGRNLIYGTDLYGNTEFKRVVLGLPLAHSITKFDSISIRQIGINSFVVNIKGNKENCELIEKCFLESSKYIFCRDDYNYQFTYDNTLQPKNFFTVSINPINQEYAQ